MLYNTKSEKLSNNFTLDELLYSRIANEHGLLNKPNSMQLAALRDLVTNVLQPLRDFLGAPIAITSGFRSPEVNRLAGGVPSSQHIRGEAADCYVPDGPQFLLQKLLDSGIEFDQVILYRKKKFLHISYRKGKNRRQVLG